MKRFHDLTGAAAAGPQRMGGLDLAGGSVRASRLGGTVLELSGVSLSLGGAPILRDFTYSFERGDRVALVGPNGAGKTTFTRMCVSVGWVWGGGENETGFLCAPNLATATLTQSYSPHSFSHTCAHSLTGQQGVDAGSVRRGDTLRFGVYEQTAEFARPDQRVADYVAQLAADAREDDPSGGDWNGWSVAQLLDRFQFSRGRQAVPVGRLSGGEKRRLQLLAVLSRRPNFVIMDEPTNDLDVETIEAVEALLAAFDGVVVVTGHDRAFVDAVADHVFVFDGAGGVSDWGGSFSELRAHQQATARAGGGGSGVAAAAAAAAPAAAAARAAAAAEAAGGAPGVVPPTPAERAEQQKARRSADNAAKKMARVEAAIEAADEALAGLDARLCEAGADAGAASVLAAQRAAAAAEQEKLFAELERLDAAARGAG